MIKFYLDKILNKVINPNTDLIWTVDDVPNYWREKVQNALK